MDGGREKAPPSCSHYLVNVLAIRRTSGVMHRRLEVLADPVDIVLNVRIGGENLSCAALEIAGRRGIPFVFVPSHHPGWLGWNSRSFLEICRRADAIALTWTERDTLEALGVARDRIHVTGTGPVLSDEIDDLLANPERRQHLARGGLERARNRFSWTLLADRVYSVYRSLGVR